MKLDKRQRAAPLDSFTNMQNTAGWTAPVSGPDRRLLACLVADHHVLLTERFPYVVIMTDSLRCARVCGSEPPGAPGGLISEGHSWLQVQCVFWCVDAGININIQILLCLER